MIAVFGLDKQVHCGNTATGCFVGKDYGFAGACGGAGIYQIGEQALGGHDPGRAWAYDLGVF